MTRTKLPVKDIYTADELLSHKLPYNIRDKVLINSMLDVMFRYVGRDFAWGKAHDKEHLHICDIIAITDTIYEECRELLEKIIRKQLSLTKEGARKEVSWFLLDFGFCCLETNPNDKYAVTEDAFKDRLRKRIADYEKEHGELTYDDGWEKELKEYCGYNNIEKKDER